MTRGFALLVTLTLVSFIVLLLVGLATYTRVETAIAGNSQRQAQARENALFALNVAVGQLQKHAGPDTRVTATAEAVASVNAQKRRYTGVWNAANATEPPVWLVSGLENGTTPAVTGAIAAANQAPLIGTNTDASSAANNVVATLQPINTPGIPGQTGSLTVGRYAWWVGDQGVKAPVAVPDASDTVVYPPYDSSDARARLRQQLSLGAGAASTAGAPVFEPRDTNNRPLVAGQNVSSPSQFMFLRTPSNGTVGLSVPRTYYHTWSPNNYAVLANTKLGGLRQDLSLQPALLGDAFVAWADYRSNLDNQTVAVTPSGAPLPVNTPPLTSSPYGPGMLRQRFRMSPAGNSSSASGAVFSIAPVLSFFGMSFSVREDPATATLSQPHMEVAVRCVATLWNPYTNALVPESLKIEVTGLPVIRVGDSAGGDHSLALQRWMTGDTNPSTPLRFSLPWDPDSNSVDQYSWLPGRVYSWAATETLSEPAGGNPMVFHHPDSTPPGAGEGVVRSTNVHHEVNPPGSTDVLQRFCSLPVQATLKVRVLRASDDTEVGTYSINIDPFSTTTPLPITDKFVDFAVIRRLPQADELPTGTTERWLEAAGRDPRNPNFPSSGFISRSPGDDPAQYGGLNIVGFAVRDVDRLLDRGGGKSVLYNEDVPLFELPRGPILSLGLLQHLQLIDSRPFSIGNPWGATSQLNGVRCGELFDRYFFSGLVPGIEPTMNASGDLVLPNQLLKLLRKADQSKVTIDDIRGLMSSSATVGASGTQLPVTTRNSYSSRFFLQGGAFNLNSTNQAAWASVLRGVRFPAPQSFLYFDARLATDGAVEDTPLSVSSSDAHFFRFSHSAEETFLADEGYAASTVLPPAAPDISSSANTHLFRRGKRVLSSAMVGALAGTIAKYVAQKQSASAPIGGPFRTLDEFLSPNDLFQDQNRISRSLLQAAIDDAATSGGETVNGSVTEFSSQYLTQADIMTALAPVLFPRSDTFIVRTYGEAVNPTTLLTEGRAWCEAIVQRLPEYFDATQPPETAPADLNGMNQLYGRRFKVVSFRWLTRSDI